MRIIETNGALPVPDEMNRWVRSSSGSRTNLPFGPIIRIRCADRQPPQQRRERAALDEPDVHLVAVRRRPSPGAEATEYGRWTILPSTNTPIVMYWPGSNGVGFAVEADPEVAQARVLVVAPDERGVVALVLGRDHPVVDESGAMSVMTSHGTRRRWPAGRCARPSQPSRNPMARKGDGTIGRPQR